MTEPSQYFKGRTVQEQMNEVIGYVDARAEEVAAAKADDVLEPAEQAKDAAQTAQAAAETAKTRAEAAQAAAETARDTTLAALPAVNERIDDVESDLNAVTLRVTTAEGDIVTIQGRVTALETADGENVKIDRINDYAVGLSGNQTRSGILKLTSNYPIRTNPVSGWGIIAVESDGVAPTGSRNYTPIQIDGVNGTLLKITHRSYQDKSSYLSFVFGRMDGNNVFRNDSLEIESDSSRTRLRMARTKNDGTVVYTTIAELTEASQ